MQNKRFYAPNSILDVEQYKFFDFDEEFVLLNPHFEKLFYSCHEVLKSFDLSFKKDIPFFKMRLARCPFCNTLHVVKYGFTKEYWFSRKLAGLKLRFDVTVVNVVEKRFKQIYQVLLIKTAILRTN